MKKLLFITIWVLSIIISIIWSYENPDKIENLKDTFKKNKSPKIENIDSEKKKYIANSFEVHSKKIIKLEDKAAFIIYPESEKIFNKEKLKIYTQNGFVIENFVQKIIQNENTILCGLGCRDSLRMEAGLSLYGNELTEEITKEFSKKVNGEILTLSTLKKSSVSKIKAKIVSYVY